MRWWNRQTNNGMTTLINGVIPMNLDEFLKHNQRLDIQDVGPWILGKVASGHEWFFTSTKPYDSGLVERPT